MSRRRGRSGRRWTKGYLQAQTRVLIMEHSKGRLALVTDQMAYHHTAQGEIEGEPWMVSF